MLVDQATNPVKYPEGLFRSAFDNEQKIGKTWKIGKDKKLKTSVVTSSAISQLEPNCMIQNDVKFSPKSWLFSTLTPEEKLNVVKSNSNLEDNDYFRSRRNNLIRQRLSVVKSQFDTSFNDVISRSMSEKQKTSELKVCGNCCAAEN